MPEVFRPGNTNLRSFLLSHLFDYYEAITFDKTNPYHYAFPLVTDWIMARKDLLDRLADSTDIEKDKEDWLHLCALLEICLPSCIRVMTEIYIPQVRGTGRNWRDGHNSSDE